jgi:ribonucleoside-diphosphate reductase beta chain
MLDFVYEDKILQNRMNADIITANLFINLAKDQNADIDEIKKALILSLIRTYFLEGVRFPASFFVTWTINKNNNNAIQGFSQALKLILWDELTVHTATGQNVLKILFKDKNQEFLHLKNFYIENLYSIANEVYQSELEWASYLLRDGEIPGYNKNIANHFLKWQIDHRIKNLGLDPIFNEEKSDIIDWFNDYRNLNKTQIALQEADNTNYQKGAIKNDLLNNLLKLRQI